MNTNELTRTLDQITDACVAAVKCAPVVSEILAGTASREALRIFGAQTLWYVSETAPSLDRAAELLTGSGRHPELVAFFRQKGAEERGHDEWAAGDLRALGDATRERLPQPSVAVKAYVGLNRALIESVTPVAYLGTAYVLERLAATLAAGAVERLAASGAASPDALVFLRGHADADPHHVAELAEVLERLDDAEEIDAILLAARATATLYPRFFMTT